MRPELGYREKGGQHTKYGEWYADRLSDAQYRNAPWCDMFIAWAAERADVAQYVGQFAWTPSHAAWFIRQNAWSDRPEPGALVFYDWSGGKSYKGVDHVGVVERVAGGKIYTIEANVDKVWLKRKVRTTEKVVGYGLPRKVKEATQARALPGSDPLSQVETVKVIGGRQPQEAMPAGPILPLTLLAGMVLSIVVGAFRRTGRKGSHRRIPVPRPAPARPVSRIPPVSPVPPPVRLHPYRRRERAGAGK